MNIKTLFRPKPENTNESEAAFSARLDAKVVRKDGSIKERELKPRRGWR